MGNGCSLIFAQRHFVKEARDHNFPLDIKNRIAAFAAIRFLKEYLVKN